MKTALWLKGSKILLISGLLILTPAIALAAGGDPLDNFLTNAANTVQSWGTKAGILYLIGSFAAVGWAAKENNPDMRAAGWRHTLGAVTTIVGCQAAPALATMIQGWTN